MLPGRNFSMSAYRTSAVVDPESPTETSTVGTYGRAQREVWLPTLPDRIGMRYCRS